MKYLVLLKLSYDQGRLGLLSKERVVRQKEVFWQFFDAEASFRAISLQLKVGSKSEKVKIDPSRWP